MAPHLITMIEGTTEGYRRGYTVGQDLPNGGSVEMIDRDAERFYVWSGGRVVQRMSVRDVDRIGYEPEGEG